MEPFQIVEANDGVKLKIICVGIGGGGCNVIEHLFNEGAGGIDLISISTDTESLTSINGIQKIQIGSKLVKGLSPGMKPVLGRECALENYNEVETALYGADIVFVIACLGGGTGTGASPIIAKIAKEVGALTLSIVTMPFKFEGQKRNLIAESGLNDIKKESDSVVIIQNEKLLPLIDKTLGLVDTFKIIDIVIEEAINGIIGVVLVNAENDINLDFADLQTVMSHKGIAVMGIGKSEGKNSANEAINQAIAYALLENILLNEATGILIHFHTHPDFPIMKISEAMEIIHESAHYDAEIIFGITTDKSLSEEYVKATMILTGFEKNYNVANNANYEG